MSFFVHANLFYAEFLWEPREMELGW